MAHGQENLAKFIHASWQLYILQKHYIPTFLLFLGQFRGMILLMDTSPKALRHDEQCWDSMTLFSPMNPTTEGGLTEGKQSHF